MVMLIKKIKIKFYYKNYLLKFFISIFFYKFLKSYYHHPKISIFMTIYNMQKYLNNSLLNIQNQTFKDIEIVAINDFSNDSSLEIIKNFAKKDNRIKIINNKKNHGLLYSRAMGILHSSGDYLMNFDADDELVGQDALEFLYNKTIISKADIISFDFLSPKRHFNNPCNYFDDILKQPELFESIYNKNNGLIDFFIWNKLIKKEIYLKALELFKQYIYSDKKWNYHEDNIWSILVNKLASSKLCVNKPIYKYNNINNSLMNIRNSELEINNIIYRLEMIGKIYNNEKNDKYMIFECISTSKMIYFNSKLKKYIKSNSYLRNTSNHLFKNCINNYKIPTGDKKYIMNLVKFFN